MPPVENIPLDLIYQYQLYWDQQRQQYPLHQGSHPQWYQHPQYQQPQLWFPQGCAPGPLPAELLPIHLPPNRLRRHKPQQVQRQQPQSQPQPQLLRHQPQPWPLPQPTTPTPPYQHSQPQTPQKHSQQTQMNERSQSRAGQQQPQSRPQTPSQHSQQPQMPRRPQSRAGQQAPQPWPQPSPQPQSQPQPPSQYSKQPQMTQGPPSRAHRSRSRPARRETRSQSPPPARVTRSQSRNPQPAPRNPSRSRSRSPFPHGEDAGKRAFLKKIADETIAAINNGIVDVTITQKDTQLFLESSHELADWRRSRPRNSLNYTTQIEVLAFSTLRGARYLNNEPHPKRKIGVLNFASATKPGGGFLNGARAQEESIARSSSLYVSLTTEIANPFYALHAGKGENSGFYTHAMIYSPKVHLFRDDDGGWTDALPVDIVTSPAVNAGKVRKRYYPGKRLEQNIEDTMHERMGRVLALFEMKRATSLVLGSFGTGVFQNDVGVVARIWRDLLINPGARFKSSFREVVFCIPDEKTREVFKDALNSQGSGRGRASSVRPGSRGGDNVP